MVEAIDVFLCDFNTSVKAVAMSQVNNLPTYLQPALLISINKCLACIVLAIQN